MCMQYCGAKWLVQLVPKDPMATPSLGGVVRSQDQFRISSILVGLRSLGNFLVDNSFPTSHTACPAEPGGHWNAVIEMNG